MATNTLHMHLYGDRVERFANKNQGGCLPMLKGHKEDENMGGIGDKTAASY